MAPTLAPAEIALQSPDRYRSFARLALSFSQRNRMHTHALRALFFLVPIVPLYANRGMVPLFALAVLVVGLSCAKARSWAWPLPLPATGLLAALLVWGAMTGLWAEQPGLALPRALTLLALCVSGMALLVGVGRLDFQERGAVIAATVAGMVAAIVIAGLDAFSHMGLTTALYGLVYGPGLEGMRGPAMFKPAASVAITIMVPALGGALFHRKWLLAAAAAAAAIALMVLSNSNAAILGLVGAAALGGLIALCPRLGLGTLALAIVLAFAAAPFAGHLPSSYDLAQSGVVPNSTIHRTAIWRFVAERVNERPMAGWGLDNARAIPGGDDNTEVFQRSIHNGKVLAAQLQQLPLHPHNFILQIWLETGLIGATLACSFLLALIWASSKLPRRSAALAGATMTSVCLMAATTFGVWQSWWVVCLWLTGIALAVALPARQQAA